MSEVFVALEGFTLPSGYICKALTIIYPNTEYSQYIFEKPKNIKFTEQDERTVRYATTNLHSLHFCDGDIPYEQIDIIFSKLDDFTIYTYSNIAVKFIQQFLPTTVVINTQELGHKLPDRLPQSNCFRLHLNYRYCSKAKAIAVKEFMENEYGQNTSKTSSECIG